MQAQIQHPQPKKIYAVYIQCFRGPIEEWSKLKFIPADRPAQAIALAKKDLGSDPGVSESGVMLRGTVMETLSVDNLRAMIQQCQQEAYSDAMDAAYRQGEQDHD